MPISETKICQNCKKDFIIEPEDFQFYDKIKVPAPTWCPECRMIRRMQWRNERTFYKRKVMGKNEPVLSIFPEYSGLKVYYQKNWDSADVDASNFAKDYDFSKPFFEQIKDLMREVPWQHSYNQNAVDSEYCSNAMDLKKCYLMFNSGMSENCAYGADVLNSRDSFDLLDVSRVEQSCGLVDSERMFACFFSVNCAECVNVFFSYNLINCHDCIGCAGLRNKRYCILNKQYTREQYLKEKEKYNFGSYGAFKEFREWANQLRFRFPVKYAHGFSNVNTTGDYLRNCKNARQCFMSRGLEDCAYCQKILFGTAMFGAGHDRDSYDLTIAGGERCYEMCIGGGYNMAFSWLTVFHLNVLYSMNCVNCSNLFACVGLRNKQYCILNKQYTKESFDKLRTQIIEHMNTMPYIDKKGRVYKYGEFFPPELSPFSYNETIAQEYFPLTKEQAIEQGYSWKDSEERNIKPDIKSEDLPDHIKDIDDSILTHVIECQHNNHPPAGGCNEQCTTAFKIIPQELEFYRKMNLPLPRLCPNCRHYQRIKQRNPLKLWKRQCQCAGQKSENGIYQNTIKHSHENQPCPNEFETSYSPDRKEIVYCEKCYQAEVA
ncbi:MAG: hypothetical protein AAB411_01705 [Patescibacteria group bacterium]